MTKAFHLTLTLFCLCFFLNFANAGTPPAKVNPVPSNDLIKKVDNTGDIDMNQFKKIPKSGRPKMRIKYSCQDISGKTIKRNDPGFDKCLEDSQSALMNKNRPVEAPSGEHTY